MKVCLVGMEGSEAGSEALFGPSEIRWVLVKRLGAIVVGRLGRRILGLVI